MRTGAKLLLTAVLLIGGCRPVDRPQEEPPGVEPLVVTSENFETLVLQSEQPVFVDCWAPWCQPCVQFEPAIRELAEMFEGRAVVAKLNVDQNPLLARRLQIEGLPTFLFFHRGELVERVEGIRPLPDLADRLERLIGAEGATQSEEPRAESNDS